MRAAEARGEHLLAYDAASRGLEAHQDDPWLAHRAVLALARSGATRRAMAEYGRLGLDRRPEPDIAALGARIAKDEALAAPAERRAALLSLAADVYAAIRARSPDFYPAVNAATLRLLAGDEAGARRDASDALALAEAAPARDGEAGYWRAASEAEAALVLGDAARASAALAAAAALDPGLAARAATRKQLKLVCAARGLDATALLAPLAPPAVIHFTGHRAAAPGARGRFPAAAEAEVASRIRDALAASHVGVGYGALASGADILVAEALLARGAELQVVLPFGPDEFKAASVAPSGGDWAARFDACLARATNVTLATDDGHLGHDALFAYGAEFAMGLAALRARALDADSRQLAVWDGGPAGGLGGTASDVAAWRASGRPVDVVAVAGDAPPPAAGAAPAGDRRPRALLFGDVKGFSKLTDAEVPAFVSAVMGRFAEVLRKFGAAVLFRNTWGDGLYVVLADARTAARCALELQSSLGPVHLAGAGLPETLALRLGAHFGPVFETLDPVLGVTGYFGAHVSRTARIEPVTPPGEVYVTEAFAARLVLAAPEFACDYVGHVPAAKGWGSMRMYHLRRAAS